MPSESAVRAGLRRWLASEAPADSELIEEFWVPRSNERADLAVLGETLDGYEIKTSQDTLKRLPRQAGAYARVFDSCSAVIAERHLEGATEILPHWWGLMLVAEGEGEVELVTVREPGSNPELDDQILVRLLWKEEAHEALRMLGIEVEPGASRFVLWESLLEAVASPRLRELVRRALVVRDPGSARIPSKRFSVATPSAGR
jgi:hypothetical protein